MCYNATASFVTGLIGLFTSWLIYKNRNGNIYFSVFFLSITTMQFLEMVIHLYDCKENEMFSYILHIALISILTANNVTYALYIKHVKHYEIGNFLLLQNCILIIFQFVQTFQYIMNGPTHDLNSRMLELSSTHSNICITKGPHGHLWWNNGLINAGVPISPPYIGAALTFILPGLLYNTLDSIIMIFVYVVTNFIVNGSNGEGKYSIAVNLKKVSSLTHHCHSFMHLRSKKKQVEVYGVFQFTSMYLLKCIVISSTIEKHCLKKYDIIYNV